MSPGRKWRFPAWLSCRARRIPLPDGRIRRASSTAMQSGNEPRYSTCASRRSCSARRPMTRTNARTGIPAEAPVEAFDLGIVSGRARSAEIQFNAVFINPAIHCLRDELTAIVHAECQPSGVTGILWFARSPPAGGNRNGRLAGRYAAPEPGCDRHRPLFERCVDRVVGREASALPDDQQRS